MPRQKKAILELNLQQGLDRAKALQEYTSYEAFIDDIRNADLILYNCTNEDKSYYYLALKPFLVIVGLGTGQDVEIDDGKFTFSTPRNWDGSLGFGMYRELKLQDVSYKIYGDMVAGWTELADLAKSIYYNRLYKLWTGDGVWGENAIFSDRGLATKFDDTTTAEFTWSIFEFTQGDWSESKLTSVYKCWKYYMNELYDVHKFIENEGIMQSYLPEVLSEEIPLEVDEHIYPYKIEELRKQGSTYVEYISIQQDENTNIEFQYGMRFLTVIYRIDGVTVSFEEYSIFKNRVMSSEQFGPYQTTYNKSKNEFFDEYVNYNCNRQFPRTEGFTLGFYGGHSFYVPLDYVIDERGTRALHQQLPETELRYLVIRRVTPYLAEKLLTYANRVQSYGVTGSLQEFGTPDIQAHLYPMRYAAAWGTYVHYKKPLKKYEEIDWLYYLNYLGGFVMLWSRSALTVKPDMPILQLWTEKEVSRSIELIRRYGDFNVQWQNVDVSTIDYDDERFPEQYIDDKNRYRRVRYSKGQGRGYRSDPLWSMELWELWNYYYFDSPTPVVNNLGSFAEFWRKYGKGTEIPTNLRRPQRRGRSTRYVAKRAYSDDDLW